MSTQQLTEAAVKAWRESLTNLPYTEYVLECKAKGNFGVVMKRLGRLHNEIH